VAGANEQKPINCVDWFQAFAFCIWDGGRLPTEAEWEYAAAGGSEQRKYPWGATEPGANANLAVYGCYFPGTRCTPTTGALNVAPVGSVPAGNGKYGQSDLAGNVQEWNLDWYYQIYPGHLFSSGLFLCGDCARISPVISSERMIRGGDWINGAGQLDTLISSGRASAAPTSRNVTFGARCVRAP
jgi:formylglycine-generating enzyme required for sulfatase activity